MLLNDVARCAGVSDIDDGVMHYREGCEHCKRRTDVVDGVEYSQMAPPPIIAFLCEFLIE
jgi:hypothetical protein